MYKALSWVRLNKAQLELFSKSAENIGTLVTGALVLQETLGAKPIDRTSLIEVIAAAVVCYTIAMVLRRDEK